MSNRTLSFDIAAFNAMIDDMSAELDKGVRPAAQAGAQVFYDQVKMNVPINTRLRRHRFSGSKKGGKGVWEFNPGSLHDAIYQVFSKDNSGDKKSVYHIGWNRDKAPYGHMVEFGTVNNPPHPFLNPAWSRRADAEDAMIKKLMEFV